MTEPTPNVGTSDQWERVRKAEVGTPAERRRAEAARRNARLCGTNPSWYGF